MSTTIKAQERKDFKNSSTKAIRSKGHVPGIIYGYKTDNKAVSLDSIDLLKTLRDEGRNAIIQLDVEGKKHSVMVNDMQMDTMKNEILHADFIVVNMDSEVDVEVPLHLTGDAQGVKDGGVLQQPLYQISITAKPNDIPQTIEVDISNLTVNETLTISDLKDSKKYTINHEDDEVIASILPPQAEEEIDSGEQQESGEPENAEGREGEEEEAE
ncbi:50S ribosomal protein L25/general stress protein Ctc [Bacillus sp. FJAT-42376]|uniref:50S ribosomal protein L25/general stress protein Ctc n=1 Tax=Bacillus sp. FJAT-42376 TaxID=2014076 RepID=UPI000F5015DE|nr:50S ribosomal protein L25/general stress protein Ctc [Bacillus sp. FJAT-42376]AZB41191.1 50S ribosomal protein L25/general stress protein Ctc [Bacillus sp. FJAT-42376]